MRHKNFNHENSDQSGTPSHNCSDDNSAPCGYGFDSLSMVLLLLRSSIFASGMYGLFIILSFCGYCSYPDTGTFVLFAASVLGIYLLEYSWFLCPSDDQLVSWYIRHESFVFQRDFISSTETVRIAKISYTLSYPYRPSLLRVLPKIRF